MYQHEALLADSFQAMVALRNKVMSKLIVASERLLHSADSIKPSNLKEDSEKNDLIVNKTKSQCEQFVMSKQKVLLMTSDNQQAKYYLYQSLLHQLHNVNNIIPIYIDLEKVSNLARPFLQSFIMDEYNLSSTQVDEIQNSVNILLIFDHYGSNKQIVNIYVSQQLIDWQAKTIVIAKYGYFRKYVNYLPCFVPYKFHKKQIELFSEIRVLLDEQCSDISLFEQTRYASTNKPAQRLSQSSKTDLSKGNTRLEQLISHPLNHHLLTNDANMMRLLADIVKQNHIFKDFLFEIIYQSRDEKKLSIAAANAITVLNYAKISFAGMNLAGIKISGADLSGAILDHTDLSNADLSNVNFSKAFLNQTLFDGSNLDNAMFGEHPFFEQENSVELLKINQAGTRLLSTDSKKLYDWDLQKYQLMTMLSHDYKIEHICLLPNDQQALLIDNKRNVLLYNFESMNLKQITVLVISSAIKFILAINDKCVVILSTDRTNVFCLELDIFNVSQTIFNQFELSNVSIAAMSNDKKYIAFGLDRDRLEIMNCENKERVMMFVEPERPLTQYEQGFQRLFFTLNAGAYFYDLKFSHDNQWLLSIGRYRNKVESHSDKLTADKIKLGHIQSGQEHLLWCENYREVNVRFISTCFSLNDKNVIAMISGDHGYVVKIWQTKTAELIYEYDNYTNNISAITFVNTKKMWDVIYGDNKGKITLVNINNKEKTVSSTAGHYVGIAGLKIKAPYAISWSDHNIRIWLAETGRLIALLRARQHNDYIPQYVFSSNDNLIISMSKNGDVKVWHIPFKLIYQTKLHINVNHCKFASITNILAISDKSNLYIYHVDHAGLKLIHSEIIADDKKHIYALKFSPDNSYLAVYRGDIFEIFNFKNGLVSKNSIICQSDYTPPIYFDAKSEWLTWLGRSEIYLYHLLTQKLMRKISCRGYFIKSIQFTSDDKIAVLLQSHGQAHRTKLELWHVDVTEPQLVLFGEYYGQLHLNRSINKLAITRHNDLIIIDLVTKHTQVITGHSDKISAFKFMNKDLLLTASTDSSIKAWKRTQSAGVDNYYLLWTSHHRFFSRDCSFSNTKNLSSANEKALLKDNVKYDKPTNELHSNYIPLLG